MINIPFPVESEFKMKPGLTRLDVADCFDFHGCNEAAFTELSHSCADKKWPLGQWSTIGLLDKLKYSAKHILPNDIDYQLGDPEEFLAMLRIHCHDDIVLLAPHNDDLKIVALAVAFPSGWDPQEKLGMNFADIHAHVPEFAGNNSSVAKKMSKLIGTTGPFRRYVWTLADNDRYSQHPHQRHLSKSDDIYYRVERQTTIPIGDGWCLFLIRVFHEKLSDIVAVDPSRLNLIKQALNSMSDEVVAYKSLVDIRNRLNGA